MNKIENCYTYQPLELSFFKPELQEKRCIHVLNKIFNQNIENTMIKRNKLANISEKIYSDTVNNFSKIRMINSNHDDINKDEKISHITHKIWITSHERPYEPQNRMINIYLNSLKFYEDNWKHYFWCLDKTKIPKTINKIMSANKNIKIFEVNEIYQKCRAKSVFEQYLKDNRFTFASDVLRYNLMVLFGGIYSDFGILFSENFIKYIDFYEYVFYIYNDVLLNGVLGSKKNGEFFIKLLDFIESTPNINEVHDVFLNHSIAIDNPPWTGCPAFTSAFDLLMDANSRIMFAEHRPSFFILKNKTFRTWRKRSWKNKLKKIGLFRGRSFVNHTNNKGIHDFPLDYKIFENKEQNEEIKRQFNLNIFDPNINFLHRA